MPAQIPASEFAEQHSTPSRLYALIQEDFSDQGLTDFEEEIEKEEEIRKSEPPTENEETEHEQQERNPELLRYGFLKLFCDKTKANSLWFGLLEQYKSSNAVDLAKDTVVFTLFRQFTTKKGLNYLIREHHSLLYHQNYFANWFLARYDIGHARAIFTANKAIQQINFFLFGIVVLLAVARVEGWLPQPRATTWLVVVFVYLFGVLAPFFSYVGTWKRNENGSAYARNGGTFRLLFLAHAMNALNPRLAATVLVGFLFLVSSNNLSGYKATLPVTIGAISVFLASLGLQMVKRIQPTPRFSEFIKRGCSVIVIGSIHALSILLLGWEQLTGKKEIASNELGVATVFVLTLGWIFNVIWAEEPITEPL